MPTFKRVSADVFITPTPAATRGRMDPELDRMVAMIKRIDGPDVVFEVTPEPDEKPAAVRLRLLRAARIAGVEIAVRKSPKGGWLVGAMTPQRRSTRGRKPKTATEPPVG